MNKIFEIRFGSHLYGTDTPESDLDIKGIYLPTAKEIILQTYKPTINISRNKERCERNTKEDIDYEYYSLDRFLDLLCQGQTVAIDLLFSPDFRESSNPVIKAIWNSKDKLVNKQIDAFIGYARTQAAKYGVKGSRLDALKKTVEMLQKMEQRNKLGQYESVLAALAEQTSEIISLEKEPLISIIEIPGPDKVTPMKHLCVCNRKVPFNATVKFALSVYQRILDEYGSRAHKAHLNGGKDYKALSHAVRVNSQGIELLQTGAVTFPRPDAFLLKAIKTCHVEYEQVAEIIEKGLVDLVEAREVSTLREKPDQEWVQEFVYQVYSDIVYDHVLYKNYKLWNAYEKRY